MNAPDCLNVAPMQQLLALLPADTRARLVGLYADLLGPAFDALGEQVHGEPHEHAARQLHKLAGGAAMLQDHDVAGPARAMEKALMEGDATAAQALWPALQAAVHRTRALLA